MFYEMPVWPYAKRTAPELFYEPLFDLWKLPFRMIAVNLWFECSISTYNIPTNIIGGNVPFNYQRKTMSNYTEKLRVVCENIFPKKISTHVMDIFFKVNIVNRKFG